MSFLLLFLQCGEVHYCGLVQRWQRSAPMADVATVVVDEAVAVDVIGTVEVVAVAKELWLQWHRPWAQSLVKILAMGWDSQKLSFLLFVITFFFRIVYAAAPFYSTTAKESSWLQWLKSWIPTSNVVVAMTKVMANIAKVVTTTAKIISIAVEDKVVVVGGGARSLQQYCSAMGAMEVAVAVGTATATATDAASTLYINNEKYGPGNISRRCVHRRQGNNMASLWPHGW